MKEGVTIKCVDLADDMQTEAVSCAVRVSACHIFCSSMGCVQPDADERLCQAAELHSIEKDIASFIKKHFDAKYKPTWHCIVGKSFGEAPVHGGQPADLGWCISTASGGVALHRFLCHTREQTLHILLPG